jgi:hypothetical protein
MTAQCVTSLPLLPLLSSRLTTALMRRRLEEKW